MLGFWFISSEGANFFFNLFSFIKTLIDLLFLFIRNPCGFKVIDIDKDKGDVVILVGEGGGSNAHTAHSQTVLEETKQSGAKSFYFIYPAYLLKMTKNVLY